MPKVKRIYVDASLEKEHVSAQESHIFGKDRLQILQNSRLCFKEQRRKK